jgi:hypothetical protein
MKMIIFFHTPNLNFRGSCVAIYDYAYYNQTLLNNKSIIITDYNQKHTNDKIAFKWFTNNFPILSYKNKHELETLLIKHNCDIFYAIKYGNNDNIFFDNIFTVVHCVFDMLEPHGDVYAGVSKSLTTKFGSYYPFVPHMISISTKNKQILRKQFRKKYNILDTDIVYSRHGGIDTFNLEFAKTIISQIVRERNDIYFIFLNAPVWDNHKQIIYLEPTTDSLEKRKFINGCDAMIVPETMGHTFGLSIGEFSILNKPIICYNGRVWNTSHLDILGDKGIYFDNPELLYSILNNFDKNNYINKNLNAYSEYTPDKVMKQFQDVFLNPYFCTKLSKDNHVSI